MTRLTVWILLILILVGAMAGAFLWGRVTASPAPREPFSEISKAAETGGKGAEVVLPEPRLALFDQVFELISRNQLPEAENLLKTTLEEEPELPFVRLALARLYIRQGKMVLALPLLHESVDRGELLSDSLITLAKILQAAPRGEQSGNANFLRAMQANPISAAAFFDAGEALRRQGRYAEALRRLKGALSRAHSDSERPIIETKLALTRLEAEDSTIAAELEAAEKEVPAQGHLLVAAAALALQQNEPARAAQLLDRAQTALPLDVFRFLISDQFFVLSRELPEMRRFFQTPDSPSPEITAGAEDSESPPDAPAEKRP